ncbi:MAG: single-stranded DNA-binding protein [Chloroflexi bacterium]|nr:single-stranded DNA-binding protein [Chloroflexota bacterium]|tara:strand:+ start:5258 stop:5842 length:585 start_codon:yes stop_codon:yes gene_type:complete
MATTYVTPDPVTLDGFQAILKPGEWGYKLSALVKGDLITKLEEERESALEWARSKSKNPKRVTVKPEPWEELDNQQGAYHIRFSWRDGDKLIPVIVDTEGTAIKDTDTPIYSGSKVKLAFFQKPYVLPTGDIGTSLKLKAVQLVSLNSGAGVVDNGDMTADQAADLFGKTQGFKVEDPNVEAVGTPSSVEDDDF